MGNLVGSTQSRSDAANFPEHPDGIRATLQQ
jgi:hypothetical protein